MSGLDKIIDHITQEARDEAGKIVSKAKEEAEKYLSDGKNDALARVAAIEKQSGLDVAAAFKRIESAADLQEKRTVLQAKQEIIESVFEKVVKREVNADHRICDELNAQVGDFFGCVADNIFWKTEFGDSVKKDTARLTLALIDDDFVSFASQVTRDRKTSRPRTDNSDFATDFFDFLFAVEIQIVVEIGNKSLNHADFYTLARF